MAAIFGDTKLEEWFKGCVWAKSGYSGPLPSGDFEPKRLTAELNDLFEIIARPRVQVLLDITESADLDQIHPRIEPRMFQPGLMQLTKVSLSLESSFLVFSGNPAASWPLSSAFLDAFGKIGLALNGQYLG